MLVSAPAVGVEKIRYHYKKYPPDDYYRDPGVRGLCERIRYHYEKYPPDDSGSWGEVTMCVRKVSF